MRARDDAAAAPPGHDVPGAGLRVLTPARNGVPGSSAENPTGSGIDLPRAIECILSRDTEQRRDRVDHPRAVQKAGERQKMTGRIREPAHAPGEVHEAARDCA